MSTIERVDVAKKGRHYLVNGKLLPSVTNVLGVLDKPALIHWAAALERDYVLSKAKELYMLGGYRTAEIFRLRLSEALGAKRAHQMRLKEAGDIGSALHDLIQGRLKGEDAAQASENALLAFMAWEEWADGVSLEPICVETMLGSEAVRAGGTLDCAAYADVPGLGAKPEVIFDWKSSKRSKTAPNGIYPESEIQVSVYREMAVEMGIVSPDAWAAVVRLPKSIDDPCINEKRLDVKWLDPATAMKHARGFLSIRDAWTYMKENFA